MSDAHRHPTESPAISKVHDLLVHLDRALLPTGLTRASDASRWTGQVWGRTAEVLVSLDRQTHYLSEDVRTRRTLGARVRLNVSCASSSRLYFVPRGFATSWLMRLIYRLRRFSVCTGPMPWLRTVTDDPTLAERVVADAHAVALVRELIGSAPDAHAASASAYVDNGRLWSASERLFTETAADFDAEHQLRLVAQLAERLEALGCHETTRAAR